MPDCRASHTILWPPLTLIEQQSNARQAISRLMKTARSSHCRRRHRHRLAELTLRFPWVYRRSRGVSAGQTTMGYVELINPHHGCHKALHSKLVITIYSCLNLKLNSTYSTFIAFQAIIDVLNLFFTCFDYFHVVYIFWVEVWRAFWWYSYSMVFLLS